MIKRISFLVLFVLFVTVGILLTAGVTFYWHYVGDLLEKDVRANMISAGEEAADSFTRALEADQHIVDTIAITVQTDYPWQNKEKLEWFLHLQVKYNEFKNLGIIPLKGPVMLARPAEVAAQWLKEVQTITLEKDIYLSSRQQDAENGQHVFVQAASLHDGQEPIGALYALIPTERYQGRLVLSSLGTNGAAYVIAPDGSLQAAGRQLQANNVFDVLAQAKFAKGQSLENIRQKIQQRENVFARYGLQGQQRMLYGVPLEINDWYLLAVLPTSFIQEQAQRLTWVSIGLGGLIVLLFGLLMCYMFRLRAYSNQQLFKTAFVDSLTGVDNLNRMSVSFAKRQRDLQRAAALVIFDILKFKVINDMLGYEQGNLVLQRAANILQEHLQPGEAICRSAADNFVLLLTLTDRRTLRSRLSKMLTHIRRECTKVDSCIMVNGVFGVYELLDQVPFYIALDRARLALENAKKSSTESIQFYDEKDRHRIVQERQLENSMEQALTDGAFTLMLQPKFNFQTGQMEGAEALVRWQQGERGLVRPDDFIPLFEKNGFILKLDMFILEQAAKMLAKWRQEGKQQVPIAVNFSRLHLNDSRYIPQMTRTVDAFEVPHDLIEVELTESVILNNRELAQNVVRGLHNKGFSVAMDDFGSGYSSLNVLKSLQFDSIKLDKEFLSGSEHSQTAKKVIQGAVEMIKSIGATIVAEGVETAEQAAFLRSIGCDLAQGYYYSRPLAIEEFEKLLQFKNPQP